MHEDRGAAPVELREQRGEQRITQVSAGGVREQHDPVGVQLVTRVAELLQRTFDVWKRQCREETEPAGMLLHQGREVLVEVACGAAGDGIPAEPGAGVRDGQDTDADPVVIHHAQGSSPRPGRHLHASGPDPVAPQLACVEGR